MEKENQYKIKEKQGTEHFEHAKKIIASWPV